MKSYNDSQSLTSLPPAAIDELDKKNHTLTGKNKAIKLYEELIQIKKERNKKNIELRPLLFHIGMALSLIMVIVAINWKSYAEAGLVDLGQIQTDVDEIIEIPISKQPPPPPPKKELFKIEEVNNTEIVEELKIILDVEVTEETAIEVIEITDFVEVEKEVVDEIFLIVEEKPTPKGGIDEFYSYLASELNYPSAALRLGVSGIVFVQFVVEKDGSITQVEVVKGIKAGCDEEAVRVIESAPAWNPGKQRSVPVRVKIIIPVRFVLAK